MASPFDDPEFAAQAAAMGFRHVPGMAESLMNELRPIMEADGVDLDNIESAEELQAALNKASEQRNLMLSVPVGRHRQLTLSVLKEFALLIDAHRMADARELLASVHPDEDDEHPAISHVIGVGSGLLDEWGRNPDYRAALRTAKLPKWSKPVTRTARDLLDAGLEHQAFDLHNYLIARVGGKAVYEAAAVATAAAVVAIARKLKRGVGHVTQDLFPEAAGPISRREAWEPPAEPEPRVRGPLPPIRGPLDGPAGHAGYPHGMSGNSDLALSLKGEQRVQELTRYLFGPTGPERDEDILERQVEIFRVMVNAAEQTGHDLNDPAQAEAFISSLQEFGGVPDDVFPEFVFTLADYVDARFEENPAAWLNTAEYLEDLTGQVIEKLQHGYNDGPLAGSDPNAGGARRAQDAFDVPVEQQVAALARVPVVSAASQLVDWIGEGRQVTTTGQLRRVDIKPVMELLGLSAVGVASVDAWDETASLKDPNHPVKVLSAADLDVLSTWWEALEMFGLIIRSKTRVYAGENIGFDFSENGLKELREFLATYVFGVVSFYLGPASGNYESYGALALDLLAEQLERALMAPEPVIGGPVAPTSPEELPDRGAETWHARMALKEVAGRMETLETLGILARTADGEWSVPSGLRPAVSLVVDAIDEGVLAQY
ncbi:MAG: hypothetical protein ACTIJJ_09385 [Galactobacter sp.]